jgi:preprotein translocase subunit YajC
LRVTLRVIICVTVLVTFYFVLPLDRALERSPVALLVLELLGLVAIGAIQVRATVRSPLPALRAVEALALSIPLLILIFSATYFLIAQSDPQSFSQPLDRLSALYFTVTVFTSTGFGDIVASSETTRAIVTGQMILDLLFLGVGLRIITSAVKLGRARQTGSEDS